MDRGRVLRRRPSTRRAPARSTTAASISGWSSIDPDAARAALRRDLERRVVVPVPRPVRSRAPARVRPALPRGVGGLRRGEHRVRRGDRRSRGTQRGRARARLPTRARRRAAARAPARSPHRALHAHAVLRPRRHRACCPTTPPRHSARRWPATRPGFHSSRWARAYQQSARAVLGRGRDDRTRVRGQPRARRRRARRGRRRATRRTRPRARSTTSSAIGS